MEFRFVSHIIDTDLPLGGHDTACFAQTALADIDGDGKLEYVMGNLKGNLSCYKYVSPDKWERFVLNANATSDVALCVMDVDGDGWLDLVSGSSWYRNSRSLGKPFEKIVFDQEAAAKEVHDAVPVDADGDGRLEVITMSDEANIYVYRIPDDPTQPWVREYIGPSVHAGISVGDIDGDGRPDIVRSDIWFKNPGAPDRYWQSRNIGSCTYPPADFRPSFAYNATMSRVCDMNQDGVDDIVFVDNEIPGGKIWWMENVEGTGVTWRRHEVPNGDDSHRRGAYHSLYVGDLDGDGDLDIFSCEMEDVGGDAPPRWYIWENLDGKGAEWKEHVVLDENLGGHAAVVGDVTGNGLPDIIAKPWHVSERNALGGKGFVLFLENVSRK